MHNLALRFPDPAKMYADRTEAELIADRAQTSADLDWIWSDCERKGTDPETHPDVRQLLDEKKSINTRIAALVAERVHLAKQANSLRRVESAMVGQLSMFGATP